MGRLSNDMQEQTHHNPPRPETSTSVRVTAMRLEAPSVLSIELRDINGQALSPASPGSHVEVRLPNGMTRPYSVVSSDGNHYVLGVKREANSQGGSAYVHDRLRVGDVVQVSSPRNHFALVAHAGPSLLIAGGIGITPLLPMAKALARDGSPWRLHYATRDATLAPFARELRQWGDQVQMHCSQAAGRIDMASLIADAAPGTHFYCCGPAGMLDAFSDATRHIEADRVHIERFGAATQPGDANSFEIHLAKRGQRVIVGPGISTLDALLNASVDVDYSCRQGICGSCEVRVLEGVPDHRDEILTEAERAGNKSMMACCSRSRSPTLVLDL